MVGKRQNNKRWTWWPGWGGRNMTKCNRIANCWCWWYDNDDDSADHDGKPHCQHKMVGIIMTKWRMMNMMDNRIANTGWVLGFDTAGRHISASALAWPGLGKNIFLLFSFFFQLHSKSDFVMAQPASWRQNQSSLFKWHLIIFTYSFFGSNMTLL